MNSQAKKVKNEILASKISVIRSLNNEQALKYELTLFFQNLKKSVLKELEEYYSDEFMFQAHADLILTPIFEAQQEYYNILRKFNHKEYQFGRKTGRRLVKLARKEAKRNSIAYADKASKTPSILKATIKKDELFGTNPWSEEKLLNQTFTASESTMNRIDSDINKILSDGYRNGKGINVVRNDITKRFDQLSSWEATRIARTEIHNAHNMGTMDIYQEMGVEYTQWIAAHDSRTRTSHLDVDREIIPMGGTYSNGLRYPGDTSGPLKEWINCRCSNAPFVIPDGYIAPSFVPFKEEDLIPTLDLYNQQEVLDNVSIESTIESTNRAAMLYGTPIKESLMKNKFAVPTADFSEFGIGKQGLKTIQRIQKRNFGKPREYGFCFDNKTGKIITDEIQGTSEYVDIPRLKRRNYSSVHNHTDNSLNAPSPEDFYEHWASKNEVSAFHLSRNETWAIQVENISSKKINRICGNIYEIEVKQIQKLNEEYRQLQLKVKKGQMTKKELDEYLANDFIYKHNKECGDKILKYTSNIKGVKVKREFNNTKINPSKIKDLKGIKTIEGNKKSKSVRKSPQIKVPTKIKKNFSSKLKKIRNNNKYEKDVDKAVKIDGKIVLGIGETFDDYHAFLNKWGIKQSALTDNEFKFVKLYSGEGDSIINGYCRDMAKAVTNHKQKLIKEKYSKEWEYLKIKHSEYYISFDAALQISKTIFKKGKILDEDLVFVRRQSNPLLMFANHGIYHSDSLLSTSISKNVKPDVYGDYLAYIVIPKGTRIFYIEGITSTFEDYEILFGMGKNLKFLEQESEYISHWLLL